MSTISEKRGASQLNTAEDLIARISGDPALPTATRQKWSAGIRGLARGARTSPAQLPADAARFTKAMSARNASCHHAEVSRETWQQYWYGWRSAARHCGLVTGQARNTAPRSDGWNACLSQLGNGHRQNLTRFAAEMTLRGIEPAAVRPEHFEIFRQALVRAAVRDPQRAFKAFSDGWRHARTVGSGLPDITAPIPHKKVPYWRAWPDFPASLEADIDAYYAGRITPKAFDVAALFRKPVGKVIRPATRIAYKNYLQALAGAAVAAGTPPAQLTSLAALLNLNVLEAAFGYLVERRIGLQRDDGATDDDSVLTRGGYHYNIAHHALTILRKHFKVPEADLMGLIGCVEQLNPKNKGMAPTTRSQLDVLCQPAVFRRIFRLPEQLFAEVERVEQPGVAEAWTAALALALAVTLDTAFRRANVTGLRTDRHLGPIDRRTGRMLVEIPEAETKTAAVYVAELRPRTVQLLDRFLITWRPLIVAGDTPFVFPDETGAGVDAARFGARLARLVTRRIQTQFTMHRVRGMLATIYAEANPGDEKTAQTKLGHRDPRTTQKFYLAPQQQKAIRRFDAVIDDLLAGLPPLREQRPARRARAAQEHLHDPR